MMSTVPLEKWQREQTKIKKQIRRAELTVDERRERRKQLRQATGFVVKPRKKGYVAVQ